MFEVWRYPLHPRDRCLRSLAAGVARFTAITGPAILSADESGRRKAADEPAAVAQAALYIQLRIMPAQHVFHDRKPEPGAATLPERPASTR